MVTGEGACLRLPYGDIFLTTHNLKYNTRITIPYHSTMRVVDSHGRSTQAYYFDTIPDEDGSEPKRLSDPTASFAGAPDKVRVYLDPAGIDSPHSLSFHLSPIR